MAPGPRLEALDGVRGIAALWVLLGHAAILAGFSLPILSEPDLGVDLFILLSGFLMVFQYELRAQREPWEQPATWTKFWMRRFFRIAPLYYITLIAALAAGSAIYDARVALDLYRHVEVQAPTRYLDPSFTNFALHFSFLFGLLPSYSFRTPLPDWSIGLEMQFYAVFPFLMLLIRRTGPVIGAILIAIASVAIVKMTRMAGIHFPMPAFLPLKMPIFLAGMIIACISGTKDRRFIAMFMLLAMGFALLPLVDHQRMKLLVRLLLVLAFAALIHVHRLPGLLRTIASAPVALLSSRQLFLLGELSFGAYLIHLLIMQPVGGLLLQAGMAEMGAAARFLLLGTVTLVPTYALAFLAYRFVEKPGQKAASGILCAGRRLNIMPPRRG